MPAARRAANPAWVDRVLRTNWSALQRLVGPSQMPAQLAPDTETPYLELGSGNYGTVFPVRKCGVVMKITSDPSEARFVGAAIDLDDWPEGIVRYSRIVELPVKYQKRHVFALWREEAATIGPMEATDEGERLLDAYVDVAHAVRDTALHMTPKERKKALGLSVNLGSVLQAAKVLQAEHDVLERAAFGTAPPALLEREANLDEMGRAEHIWRGLWGPGRRTRAQEELEEVEHPMAGALRTLRGPRRIAGGVKLCRRILRALMEVPDMELVAEALTFYLSRDILLADVHGGNLGQVIRTSKRALTVITDPGHAVFLTAAYEGVQIPRIRSRASNPRADLRKIRQGLLG